MPKNNLVPFWEQKSLSQMTDMEWESLCDGCALCCLIKLEDADTQRISYTDIACKLLDSGTCRCTDYKNRQHTVPDCITLSTKNVKSLDWMPATCAYRLIAEEKKLAWWHPLVSGDPNTVHQAGISVRGRVIPEQRGDDPEDRIINWVNDSG